MVLTTKQTLCREVLVSSDGIKRLELYNIGSCNTSLKVRWQILQILGLINAELVQKICYLTFHCNWYVFVVDFQFSVFLSICCFYCFKTSRSNTQQMSKTRPTYLINSTFEPNQSPPPNGKKIQASLWEERLWPLASSFVHEAAEKATSFDLGWEKCEGGLLIPTRLAPTSYKWAYNPYKKGPYTLIAGIITLLLRVITPFISGRGLSCIDLPGTFQYNMIPPILQSLLAF